MTKQLLFRLTRKDFRWTYHHGSGAGGQKRNKSQNAVRCHHDPSGAMGHAQESRSVKDNESNAFVRCVTSDKFKAWHKLEIARRTGRLAEIEEEVARSMRPDNLRVEVFHDGRWVAEDDAA